MAATAAHIMEGCWKFIQHLQETPSEPEPVSAEEEKEKQIRKKIEEICQELILSNEDVAEVSRRMLEEINRGLSKTTNQEATVKCFPTYVKELPNGTERGKFLALDLGGTNFRVLLIELGDSKFKMDSKIFAVPQSIMVGPGTGLFDHIAECLATFMKEHDTHQELLPLGFTFSFPCKQEGLIKARLMTWTKGFKCAGVEGEDVVRLLREAIARRGDVQIDVCAVVNDTTGTLMSCAWKNPSCRVGLIVGTGTNACYLETLDNVELWDGDMREPHQVIINTEWGAFGDNGALDFVRTQYDREIDAGSINSGKQLYEKMISGMYMGEVTRLVLVRLTNEGLLFDGKGSDVLFQKGKFITKYISDIERDRYNEKQKSDMEKDYMYCRDVLNELSLDYATDADCENLRYVCECVSRRAAHLVSAGVAMLLNKMGKKKVTVAIDGSVYRFHPFFHELMMEKVSEILQGDIEFNLMLSEDGSGRGAALVAAVACRARGER